MYHKDHPELELYHLDLLKGLEEASNRGIEEENGLSVSVFEIFGEGKQVQVPPQDEDAATVVKNIEVRSSYFLVFVDADLAIPLIVRTEARSAQITSTAEDNVCFLTFAIHRDTDPDQLPTTQGKRQLEQADSI